VAQCFFEAGEDRFVVSRLDMKATRMSAAQRFRELTETMRPQDPRGDGTGLSFETGEHGSDCPDNMPQAITGDRRTGPVGGVCATASRRQDRRARAAG
jgi:hypothetical protein